MGGSINGGGSLSGCTLSPTVLSPFSVPLIFGNCHISYESEAVGSQLSFINGDSQRGHGLNLLTIDRYPKECVYRAYSQDSTETPRDVGFSIKMHGYSEEGIFMVRHRPH